MTQTTQIHMGEIIALVDAELRRRGLKATTAIRFDFVTHRAEPAPRGRTLLDASGAYLTATCDTETDDGGPSRARG